MERVVGIGEMKVEGCSIEVGGSHAYCGECERYSQIKLNRRLPGDDLPYCVECVDNLWMTPSFNSHSIFPLSNNIIKFEKIEATLSNP